MPEIDYKKLHNDFKAVLKTIKKYDRIVCYRHVVPDFDAFGSQMGMVAWLKANFPEKEIHFVGESNPDWVPSIYPQPETLDDTWYAKGPFLAIVTDTATLKRISMNTTDKADFIIKIDHHPNVEPYGNLNVVYPDFVSAAELVGLFQLSKDPRYEITQEGAKYLYSGIVGDSGRFLYDPLTPAVLSIASALLAKGFDVQKLYDRMYAKSIDDMEALKFVLNNTKITKGGTAYYVLTQADLDRLHMTSGEGKLFVNQFRNVDGIWATVSVTEDSKDHVWRVSLRSNVKPVEGVATKYRGGGHQFASGATLNSLDELPNLLADLDAVKRIR